MRREELADLNAFLAVAEEQSFTRAAAKLGTSQSALSYTLRRLETRLGVRLLTRTTRLIRSTIYRGWLCSLHQSLGSLTMPLALSRVT